MREENCKKRAQMKKKRTWKNGNLKMRITKKKLDEEKTRERV
jgi:hypothetical protein